MINSGIQKIMQELQHRISCDSSGNMLEGGRQYKLHLPSGIPASEFWSILVYDSQSHLIIQTDQAWPSVFMTNKNLLYNDDGSIDAWFGPEPGKTRKVNWVKTIAGRQWYLILRLYYPLESWFDKTWRPGEIEPATFKNK